jgi:hypothetical protein
VQVQLSNETGLDDGSCRVTAQDVANRTLAPAKWLLAIHAGSLCPRGVAEAADRASVAV